MDWDEFGKWFARRWEPGEHVSVYGPTGSGKTVLMVNLGNLRKWVMALDVKGGDRTLRKAIASGWRRCTKWPLPQSIRSDIQDGEPVRLVMGRVTRTVNQRQANRAFLKVVATYIWEQGHWTVLADELILLVNKAFLDMKDAISEMLIAARDLGMSVVSAAQSPSTGLPLAGNQSSWLFIGYTRDRRVVDRLAEMMGRPAPEVRGAMKGLAPPPGKTNSYAWLLVGRNPSEPIVVTRCPMLAPAPDEVPKDAPPKLDWRERLWPPRPEG
jgi:hypothetical protein